MLMPETRAHMLLECDNYTHLREWPTEKGPFHHDDPRILHALGWIREIPARPDGTHPGNISQAKKNLDAAVAIWHYRCKLEIAFRQLCQTAEDHDIAVGLAQQSDSSE